jgi:hypothetical protein
MVTVHDLFRFTTEQAAQLVQAFRSLERRIERLEQQQHESKED